MIRRIMSHVHCNYMKRDRPYRRSHQSVEKRYWACTSCTKSSGELLCPKRSTGTFWSESLLGYVKRGGGLVRLPSKCFRISHPLLRFFEIRGFRPLRRATRGSTPRPRHLWKGGRNFYCWAYLCNFFRYSTFSTSWNPVILNMKMTGFSLIILHRFCTPQRACQHIPCPLPL